MQATTTRHGIAPRTQAPGRMRVRQAMAVMLTAVSVTVLLAIGGLIHVSTLAGNALSTHAENLSAAQDLRIALQRGVSASRAFTLTHDPEYRTQFENEHAEFNRMALNLSRRSPTVEGRQMLAEVVRSKAIHADAARRLMAADPEDVQRMFETEVAPLSLAVQVLLDRYTERKRSLLASAQQRVEAASRRAAWLLIAVATMSIALGVAVALYAVRTANRLGKLSAELKSTLKSRDYFLAAAGHELRNPLSVLGVVVQLLVREEEATQDQAATRRRRLIDMLQRNVATVTALTDRLLDVSLIDRGQLKLERSEADLSLLARDAALRARPLLAGKPCDISVIAPEPVFGHWDPVRLGQVIDNLLGNALRYACKGTIEVGVRSHGDAALLSVRDHGPGLSMDEQARIFDRYERVGISEDGSGLGLGLSISREIVQSHGGTIGVESAPGDGAAFIVELPRA